MRHAILGPGGVGGLIGSVLAGAGEHVTLVVRPSTESHYPREISLTSPFGSIQSPVAVSPSLTGSLDVLWITLKATQLVDGLRSVTSDLEVSAVVPLLNGIDHLEKLRLRFGYETVIPATIAVESERVAPGKIVQRSPFVRLNLATRGNALLATSVEAFRRFGFECNFVENEATLLWSKLVFLAPLALSTSACRCSTGKVLSDPKRAAQLEDCVREACAVATASGASVEPTSVLGTIRKLPADMRSSMEKDVSSGKSPELDAIAGPIVRGGQKYGISVPATLAFVKEIERSKQE